MDWANSWWSSRVKPTHPSNLLPEYDFIIVGAGAAGCVVAARLTEDVHAKVLLIEAGEVDGGTHVVPLNKQVIDGESDWGYESEKQSAATLCGEPDAKHKIPLGKGLGGSTATGNTIYSRGSPQDYEKWEKNGAAGWGYYSILEYFLKGEDCRSIKSNKINTEFHSFKGPLTVEFPSPFHEIGTAFMKACLERGATQVDYNAQMCEGAAYLQHTVRDGVRCSAAVGYLQPASKRKNLHVVVGANVEKIVLENTKANTSPKATGVFCRIDRADLKQFSARNEVILCAGTVNTPKLLLLSGIGPRRDLEKVGITCIKELASVGKNLEDHLRVPLIYKTYYKEHPRVTRTGNRTVLKKKQREQIYSLMKKNGGPMEQNDIGAICCDTYSSFSAWSRWLLRCAGVKASSGYSAQLTYSTGLDNDSNLPDSQIKIFCGVPPIEELEYCKLYPNPMLDDLQMDIDNPKAQGFTLWVSLLHPHSKGHVKLRSADPKDAPLIDPMYLSDSRDLETMKAILKQAHNLVRRTKSLGTLVSYLVSGPCILDYCQDEEDPLENDKCLTEYIRSTGTTGYALGCTCRMGEVVNSDLTVVGVDNLRIIDASVMPTLTSGDICAPTMMIAEKGSSNIVEKYGLTRTLNTQSPRPSDIETVSAIIMLFLFLYMCVQFAFVIDTILQPQSG